MQIPRSLLDDFSEEISAISLTGQEMIDKAMPSVITELTNSVGKISQENIAALRESAIEVMEMACQATSEYAAARAASFYDEVRLQAGVAGKFSALTNSNRDTIATNRSVRGLIQSVVDTGDTEKFTKDLKSRVDYETKRAAGECVAQNALKDPAKPKWARVPTGADTCSFCIMLAGRGFEYHSDTTAGQDNHYHAHCDCRIVPGFKDMQIEGYDTEAYYRQYLVDLENGRINIEAVLSESSRKQENLTSKGFDNYADIVRYLESAIDIKDLQLKCAYIEKEWKKTSLRNKYRSMLKQAVMNKRYTLEKADKRFELEVASSKIDVSKWIGKDSSGVAKFETRTITPHEFNAYRVLMSKGNNFTVKSVSKKARMKGKSSPDIVLEENRWELKCPDGNNEKKTISRNLNKAILQMKNADPPTSRVRIVLSALETNLPRENIEYHVNKKIKKGVIDEILVIYSENDIKRYKK